MRTEFPVDLTTRPIDDRNIVSRKHAVPKTDIDGLGQRSTNASKKLPCETGVRIINTVTGTCVDCSVHISARHANTATKEGLKAIIGTKISQTVDHETECIGTAASGISASRCKGSRRATGEARSADSNRVDISFTVAGLGFEASAAEVVTYDTAEVVTFSVIDRKVISLTVNVEIEVFHEHYAAVEFDVPRIFAGMGRRCKHRRRHRHTYDEFPHYKIPL